MKDKAIKKFDVEAFSEHYRRGFFTVFVALCFDVIKFDGVIERISLDEKVVDDMVEYRAKQGLDAAKRSFNVKFDGYFGPSNNPDVVSAEKFFQFGGMYAYSTIQFSTASFEVVKSDQWTFDKDIVEAEIKRLTKMGIKAALVERLVKFDQAFSIVD